MNTLTRLIIYLLLPLAINSCATSYQAPQIKTAKSCVIVTDITDQVKFHTIGFTAFGNRSKQSEIPGLRKMAEQVLKEEVGRHYQIKAVTARPNAGPKEIEALVKASGAELLVKVSSHDYYPYGVPSYLTVHGFGVYGGSAGAREMVACYTKLSIFDASGNQIAAPGAFDNIGRDTAQNFLRVGARKDTNSSPLSLEEDWNPDGYNAFAPSERQLIFDALRDQFRTRVRDDLRGMGLE